MMKRYLFIDNFRGFANAYIPIVDVNFLVGENSSGKTSVLGLLKLFSSPRFLMGKDFFNDEDVSFGHFSDMVSAHAENRTYFRIGMVDEQANNKAAASGMLLTYREHGGLAQLSRLSHRMGSRCVHLRTGEKQTFYRSDDLPQVTAVQGMASGVMPHWISEHSGDGPGYKSFPFREGLDDIPIIVALSWAERPPKDEKRPSFAFSARPWFSPEVAWVAPIRTKPRRTYDELQSTFSAEGSHTPYLIKRILDSKSEAKKFQEFITRAGAASGLFQSIKIKPFGSDVTAPFEVDVVLDDKALNLSTVGYGVSQSLPIFVELLVRPSGSVFAIQQPEVHLHPRAQAALGDVFFEMAVNDKKSFLIETHSDFTIDRFRMNYLNKGTSKPNSQILFFERRDKMNTVTALTIGSNGELPSEQPDSYRRFFIKEEMRLLGL
jgi:predicted ATPase